jgi:hypothetical protein
MLGCEIIEAFEAGDLILWSRSRAEATIRSHGCDVAAFTADIAPAWQNGKIAAATVLVWLGY